MSCFSPACPGASWQGWQLPDWEVYRVLWSMMHDYQRRRVMTLLDPTQDALGAGYHTIQSTIAIGSGGRSGQRLAAGNPNPSRLSSGEKHRFHLCGIFGGIRADRQFTAIALVSGGDRSRHGDRRQRLDPVYSVDRRLDYAYIFTYIFVNIGMVIGILPVVGVPLPLISYGGTSMVTMLLGFGILMSIQMHPKLVKT